ncbi:hypothetical protein LJC60_08645 [Ruminococcaceae bacterium OttesenSCG-928-D13]|nr:hypothetical protein [Ruminococcaceae bacterium OttesenSCG-928-D13]
MNQKLRRIVVVFLAGLGCGVAFAAGWVVLNGRTGPAGGEVLIPLLAGLLVYLGYMAGLLRAEAKRQ